MATLENSYGEAEQPLTKSDFTTVTTSPRVPRRKATLTLITILLNILIWSAFICLVTSTYQIISDPWDTTNIAAVALTLTSASATITYTLVHTVFSFRQKIWEDQQQRTSAPKNTSYVAIRLAISLCVLWLLTTGWNMIIVARRPTCLDEAPGLQGWEFGPTCLCSRVGIAFAAFSLITSFVLFGILATVNRPFEAHLFKHGYQKPADISQSPCVSRGSSPIENRTWTSEKRMHDRHGSASTRRNGSTDRAKSSNGLPPMTNFASSRARSSEFAIFTSPYAPPPIPPAYLASRRNSSVDASAPVSHPSIDPGLLTRPPCLSGATGNSESVPLFVPTQYSASTWRAIHPEKTKSTLWSSRSHPDLSGDSIFYQSPYPRSSISLTRPTRLSSLSSSLRSESAGSEKNSDVPFLGSSNGGKRASSSEIAYAITHGTPIPGTERVKTQRRHHMRTISAPHAASNVTYTPPEQFEKTHDGKVISRKPVPVRRLRSADRMGISSAATSAAAAKYSVNRMAGAARNRSDSAHSVETRRMTFEQMKNKPLPKIAVF